MWKAFEKSAKKNIPQAAILYDKFHVMNHRVLSAKMLKSRG
jgi:transposase